MYLIIKMPSIGKKENISLYLQTMFVGKAKFKKFGPNKGCNKGRETSWLRTP